MKGVMVRYTVKPEAAAANEALVRAVYEELQQTQPAGMRYATFKLDDGVSFVHINFNDNTQNVLTGLASFKEFQQGIGARCAEGPTANEMSAIGSYRLETMT
jgi:hypothetical protein